MKTRSEIEREILESGIEDTHRIGKSAIYDDVVVRLRYIFSSFPHTNSIARN